MAKKQEETKDELQRTGKLMFQFSGNPKFAYGGSLTLRMSDKGKTYELIDKQTQQPRRFTATPNSIGQVVFDLSDDVAYEVGKFLYITAPNFIRTLGWKGKWLNPEKDAQKRNMTRAVKRGLFDRVSALLDNDDDTMDLANNLGLFTDVSSIEIVKDAVFAEVDRAPDVVLDVLNDPDYEMRCIVFRAKDKEVCYERDEVYYYNNQSMGTGVKQAVQWLRDNPAQLSGIKKQLGIKDKKAA